MHREAATAGDTVRVFQFDFFRGNLLNPRRGRLVFDRFLLLGIFACWHSRFFSG